MRNNLVSIITPSYNSSKFIVECVNSVISQTFQNWEMIIVDDCSNDNSKDIISVLPTSQIFDYKRIDRYVNMVDFATLKDIVLDNDFKKSPTIQKIFNYTSEELQDPRKIKLDAENVDCQNLINDRNHYVNKLF